MHGDLRHMWAHLTARYIRIELARIRWKISYDMHTIRLNISDNFHRDDAWKSDINLCCWPSDSQRSSTWADAERMNNFSLYTQYLLMQNPQKYASTPLSQLDCRLCRVVAGSITCVVFLFLIQFRLFMVAGRATFNAWDYVKWLPRGQTQYTRDFFTGGIKMTLRKKVVAQKKHSHLMVVCGVWPEESQSSA